jgi:hypothetical protein
VSIPLLLCALGFASCSSPPRRASKGSALGRLCGALSDANTQVVTKSKNKDWVAVKSDYLRIGEEASKIGDPVVADAANAVSALAASQPATFRLAQVLKNPNSLFLADQCQELFGAP